MKKTSFTVIITIICVVVSQLVYVKLSSPSTLFKTISALKKFPSVKQSSHDSESSPFEDKIESLKKQKASLSEKHTLLLKEYSYYSLKGKLTRGQTIARVKEMKDITNQRLEIEHQIDSLLLIKNRSK